ncbi:hypothetical protein [Nostoc sp.]|uniref:hypothetical protein n=1 Tax=Nostoc sp. TaxID=1180 RepID=UPI002FFC2E1F
MPRLATVQPKYDLWRVDYINGQTFGCVEKYYLCDDSDAIQAFIEATVSEYNGAGWEIKVGHYPSIKEDYPDAVVIPSTPKELENFITQARPFNK